MEDVTNTNENVADNSADVSNQEPTNNVDNSNEDTNSTEPGNTDSGEDNGNSELIGGKFKTQNDLLNAYNEIEKQRGETSKELGELRKVKEQYDKIQKQQEEIAQAYGYESVADMQQASQQMRVDQDLANYTADEYIKYIGECEFPDEMKSLLMRYKQNPNPELLDTIESEFSKGTLKKVAENLAIRKGQLDYARSQAQIKQEMATAENFLQEVTTKYDDPKYFQDASFRELFAEMFKAFGVSLKTEESIGRLEKYVQSRIALYEKTKASKSENSDSTDAITGLENSNPGDNSSGKSVLDMSEEELRRELRSSKYRNL